MSVVITVEMTHPVTMRSLTRPVISFFLLWSCLGYWLPAQEPVPSAQSEDAVMINVDDLLPPEKDLYEKASAALEAKDYPKAVTTFLELIRFYPDGTYQEEALYQSAFAYRELGRFPEATQLIELLLTKKPKTTKSPDANLLLGEMALATEEWESALGPLKKASRSPDPATRERAHYFRAIAAERLGTIKKASTDYDALLKNEEGRYRDFAALRLARIAIAENETNEAKNYLKKVLSLTTDAATRAEAAVRSGNLSFEENDFPGAVAYYEIVRRTESPDNWLGLASLGLVRAYYAMDDYEAVIRVSQEVEKGEDGKTGTLIPPSSLAQFLFMQAESQRLTEEWSAANSTYDAMIEEDPSSPLRESAEWGKILSMQMLPDSEIIPLVQSFLNDYPKSDHVEAAQLIVAQDAFENEDYTAALPLYAALASSKNWLTSQSVEYQEQILFRTAFCYTAAEEAKEALQQWTAFLQQFPESDLASTALWLKAQSELTLEQNPAALKTLTTLLNQDPDFSQREKALRDAGYLAAGEDDSESIVHWFTTLLSEYPLVENPAEIHYWLAIAYQKLGETEPSIESWRKARALAPDLYSTAATKELLRLALENKDLEMAQAEAELYDEWLIKEPESTVLPIEVYEWIGQELSEKELPAAEPYLRRVLAATEDANQRQRVQLRLSRLMSALEKHGAAIREWKTYRVNYPDDADRFEVSAPLIEALLGAAEYDEARKMIEFLLRRYPEGIENAQARIYLGDLSANEGKLEEAGKIYRTVSLLISDDALTPLALYKAEDVYRRAGNDQEADQALLKLNKEYRGYDPPTD
ncbi:MAG: tetratricopeptide repeat protein [Verrucomicrobiota bacterium]